MKEDPPLHLFKYMKKKHAERFMKEGRIRIGTLYDYRNTETHGDEVGDSLEGQKIAELPIRKMIIDKYEDIPEFITPFFTPRLDPFMEIRNINFQILENSPDYYIYSMSEVFDATQMKEFGYDACVRIDDLRLFLQNINKCVCQNAKSGTLFRCIYALKTVHHSQQKPIHPALLKDPRFARQKEFRVVWEPKKTPIVPLNLKCRELNRCCSRFC